jgi:hypothetical protein
MIEAKGRNGYFKVRDIEVWRIDGNAFHPNSGAESIPPEIHIEIYSRRHSGSAPARIQGTEEEMRNLIGALYVAIVKNGTEFQNPVKITVNEEVKS